LLFLKSSVLCTGMPNTSTAKRALRKNKKNRAINLVKKDALKAAIKEYKKIALAGKGDEAKAKLPAIYKKIDKAAKINLIKKNKAARLKSRLAKKIAVPVK